MAVSPSSKKVVHVHVSCHIALILTVPEGGKESDLADRESDFIGDCNPEGMRQKKAKEQIGWQC